MTWHPKSSQNGRAFRSFIESMDVINEAICFPPKPVVAQMGRAARRVSIELRKLLFDSMPLLHVVLHRPRLRPLNQRQPLSGDVYEKGRILSIAPGTSAGPLLEYVSTRRWHIKVNPLHGLRFDSTEKKWTFYLMFDNAAVPISLDRWLRQRVFFVDDREYSLFDTLKFLSNKEAAHVDTTNSVLMKDMERVHFGHTTYYHIVAILTAAYLLSEYQASQRVNKSEWQAFHLYRSAEINTTSLLKYGEFSGAEIEPLGFPHVFQETGLPIPTAGEPYKPVHLVESTVVYT